MGKLLVLIGVWWFTESLYAETVLRAKITGSIAEVSAIQRILPGVQKVINSKAFEERILRAKFTSTKDSPETILKKIRQADWDLEYEFKLRKNWRGKCPVLGWTYLKTKKVWFNSCNFMGRKDQGIAGTIGHEHMHTLGYKHRSARDKMSVPYSVGTVISELYEKLVNGQEN